MGSSLNHLMLGHNGAFYVKRYIWGAHWNYAMNTWTVLNWNFMLFWIGTYVGFWTSYVSSHKSSRHVPSFYRLVVEDISSAGAGRYTCQVVLLVSFKNQRKERWLVSQKRRQEGRSKRKKTASYNLSLILTRIGVSFFSHVSSCHSFWSVFLLLCHQE